MKTNEFESPNAAARQNADVDWDALIERRLSADLDAFLADADDATFRFPAAESFAKTFRGNAGVGGEIATFWSKSRAARRAFLSASWTALTAVVVWGLISFGVFENVFAPKPTPEAAFHDFFAVGGVESFRAVDAALERSDQFAADSLRRVGEWKDENVSKRFGNLGLAVDSRWIAPQTDVDVVWKNDPIVRFVDEYYLSDFNAKDASKKEF